MATVAKLTQQGELKLSGNIDTRLPLVTDGLVSHYPMDGPGGTFDMISGNQSLQNTSKDVNLIEAMKIDWRDPASWNSGTNMTYDSALDAIKIVGYSGSHLKTPVVINANMSYEISIEVMETIDSAIGLYLGGMSYDEFGVRATTNNDYTMAANYEPALGEWVIYKLTRTGTAIASNGNSFSFDTVKGWTGDGGLLVKYYHLGGLFNYNSGGELYVRNPSIRVIDTDTSNTTITNDYVAIEESTTNVITNTNLDTGWSKSYCKDILWNDTHPPLGIDSQVVSFKDSDGNGSGYWYCYGNYAPQDPSTTYTISIYARTFGADASMYAYTADNSEVGRQSTNTLTIPGNGEWIRLIYNPITTPVDTQSDSLSFNIIGFPAEQRLWLCAPQMEAKAFATEFVDGSRAVPKLTIPNPVKTGEFTVSYDWKSGSPVGTTSSYQTSFSMGTYNTNNSFTIMDILSTSTSGVQKLIRKGNAAEWAWSPGDLTTAANFNDWNTITIVRNASYYRVYSNGVYKGQLAHLSTTMQDFIHIGSRESWRAGESSSAKNLSIYNRALSDDEILKNAKGTHTFTEDGLITKSINTTGEIRYIRDYLNESTSNTSNHWVEIKANTQDGVNVALGILPTSSIGLTNIAYITDGIISSLYAGGGGGLAYVQIDLGSMQLIDNIQVWHYYTDGRTYYGTRTQVSHDGVKWYDIFNSATNGTYAESINGITHYVGGSGEAAMKASSTGLATNGISSDIIL